MFLRASYRLTAVQHLISGQHPTPRNARYACSLFEMESSRNLRDRLGKHSREPGQVDHEHPFKTFKDVPSEPKESIVNKSGTGDQGPSIFQCCLHKPLAGCVNQSLVELFRQISYSCFSNMGPNYASVKFVRTVRFSDHCPPSHSSKIICLGMSGDRSQLSLNFACFFLGMWHIFHPPMAIWL